MRADDIAEQLKRGPLVPFRMCSSGGTQYDVRRPEILLVSRRALALTVSGRPGAKMAERITVCDPMHIARIEQINRDGQRSAQKP